MRNFLLFIYLFLQFTALTACAAKTKELIITNDALLKNMSCDKLIEKSKTENYILNHLAGLYANRNCKGFIFDFKKLTELEKKIFKAKFDELDESKKNDLKDTDTIESLKLSYKTEKNQMERFSLFKKLRQKYKSAGQKDDSLKLIKSNHDEMMKLVLSQKKIKKPDINSYDLYIDSAYIYAKALWNDSQDSEALKIISAALKNINNHQPTFTLSFLAAKIQEDKLMFDSAIKSFNESIANYKKYKDEKITVDKSFDRTFDLPKVEWNKAWIQYKNDTPEAAAVTIKSIVDNSTDSAEKSRASFFLAKLYKKLDKLTEAKKILEQNIANDLFSFYSLASYYELRKPLPSIDSIQIQKETFQFDIKLTFLAHENKDLFLSLIKNEEFEISDRACTVLSKSNTEYVNMGLYLAANSQYFSPLFTGFAKLSSSDKKEVFVKYSRLIFPEVHSDKVTEMSKKTNVEKSLIYSIMKQESGFNSAIRSSADALGLMQVIPRLAKDLAKKYKIDSFKKTEDLFNPLVNIELGTYELKDQVEKQSGQLSFVASAYNAGPGALKQWRSREPIKDMFEFIENIPYDETRTYVKIIARNMLFYQRLASPDKELNFPIEFVKTID